MRILVPLDGSPLAERALDPATALLRHVSGTSLLLLTRVASVTHEPEAVTVDASEDIAGDLIVMCQEYLREIAQRPTLAGLQVRTLVEQPRSAAKSPDGGVRSAPDEKLPGDPLAIAQTIIAIAQSEQIDLIIMTSHGRTGFVHQALGDVAEAIARDASIPTLILRPNGAMFPEVNQGHPFTILVPLDGTSLAETALDQAMLLARAFHGTIQLLEVLTPEAEGAIQGPDRADQAFSYLTHIHDRLENEGILAHRSLAWGHPLYQIAMEVQRAHADLIAIAAHGRDGPPYILNGTVTLDIFHDVDRPILVLHPFEAIIPDQPGLMA